MIGRWLQRLGASWTSKPIAHDPQTLTAFDELFAQMESQARPCVRLTSTDNSVRTRIGGRPPIQGRFEWPHWNGQPLGFVAQIELTEIQSALPIDWLPSEGRLLFFYDPEQNVWGFDPKDKGGCVVIFDPNGEPAPSLDPPQALPDHGSFSEKNLAAASAQSHPSLDRFGETVGDLSTHAWDALDKQYSPPTPVHQIGGYPWPVQNDGMELESQLASNGVYVGNAEGYTSSDVEKLKDGAKDWLLLLQIDSDDEAGIMWGDIGMLYFWIRRQDAEKRDFSNVWVVLQCC